MLDHGGVHPVQHQTLEANEAVASALATRELTGVSYFPMALASENEPVEWDFGVWHQPTMGVELTTAEGSVYSLIWNQYGDWGFGVDLYDLPAAKHLIDGADAPVVEVSDHPAWAPMLGRPIAVSLCWNDYGTGLPPCPEAIQFATEQTSLWTLAADWSRTQGRTSIQLGMDDLMVVFDKRFVEAIGLYDRERGTETRGATKS
jgi:hypothetical protein